MVPTAKYQYLKAHDWENSLIFKYMQSQKMDRLIIVDQETQGRLLMQADIENEDDDYCLEGSHRHHVDQGLYTQLLS